MAQQMHRSDPQILNRRTLERDHRVLAAMLRPGMSVLDVGCGTGAITAGIARSVAPGGWVVGVDRDESLLEVAWQEHGAAPALSFQRADAVSLEFEDEFDVVTAARVVQWIADPALAVSRMADAVKPGGVLVVLDYNHAENFWTPDPPAEFARFYAEFLAWRASNGWDNAIADRLPELFAAAGLSRVESVSSDETVERGAPEFAAASAIWVYVIDGLGRQFYDEGERVRAASVYREYCETVLDRQALSMRTVIGWKPA